MRNGEKHNPDTEGPMTGPNDTVEVIDIHGPFAGQRRTYLRHAAEAAVTNGFAKWPSDDTEIPEDFPGRAELSAAGFEVLEKIPTDVRDLTDLPGIGKKTAARILEAIEA